MRVEDEAAFFDRQHAAVIGEGVDEDHGVLARFDDLVEVADRTAAHGAGQGAVDPHGFLAAEQVTPHQVAGAEVLVAGDGDERLTEAETGRGGVCVLAIEDVRHILHETRFAAAGGAGEQHGQAGFVGGKEHLDLVSQRHVVGDLLQLRHGVSDGSGGCHWGSLGGGWREKRRRAGIHG